MKEEILSIVKQYGLIVSKYYMFSDGKLISKYHFENYCNDLSYDKYFLSLNLPIDKIAEIAYNALQIKQSQENEFYID